MTADPLPDGLSEKRVDLGGGHVVRLRGPAEPERLLEETLTLLEQQEKDRARNVAPESGPEPGLPGGGSGGGRSSPPPQLDDEKMPYWAELWPAAIAVSKHMLHGPTGADVRDRDVLELGCGLGLAGIAAALAGAREVTFSDYYDEAVRFAMDNAALNGVADRCRPLPLDWRRPPGDRRWPVLLGADILYERRMVEPLVKAIGDLLAPGGIALIADPVRTTAETFHATATRAGWTVDPVKIAPRATLYRLTR